MKLGKYDVNILETLSNGRKNIYRVHQELEKIYPNRRIDYAVIKRAVERLETKKLTQLADRGVRNAKIYDITLTGLGNLYIAKRRNNDALQFHRSAEGQKIIKKIERYILDQMEQVLNEQNKNQFAQYLHASPSFTEFFATENIETYTISIKNLDFSSKLVSYLKESPIRLPIIKNIDTFNLMCLLEFYPRIFLSKDIKKYPDDHGLADILVSVLIRSSRHKEKIVEETFTIEHELQKHLVIYVPQVGNPMLAYKDSTRD